MMNDLLGFPKGFAPRVPEMQKTHVFMALSKNSMKTIVFEY
ncbi:hypothetical protein [Thiomicrospira sp. WB1]|nr:hypothetical protein [Thiomicrospira sp. WB1]